MKTRTVRVVGLALFVVVIVGGSVIIWAVQSDYYGLPLNLNPAPQPTIIPFLLEYPPSSASPITVRQVSDPPVMNETCVFLSVKMEWNGTLAQNTPIKFLYSGILPVSDYCKKYLQEVQFGFYGDYPVGAPISQNELDFGGTLWGIFWGSANLTNASPYESANQSIYFPASGEYSPTVVLDFVNFTNPQRPSLGEAQYTYSNRVLPVASSLDIQNAKNAKIQTDLTYVIVAFVFLEGFDVILRLTEEKNQGSLKAPPTHATMTPDASKNSPNNQKT